MKKLFVIKIGGDTLNDEKKLKMCLEVISQSGKDVILVHGGGKKVTELSEKLGIEQTMVDGRRVTSKETMELCTMVYAGLINKNIVAKFAHIGLQAFGISGADASCITSKKRQHPEIDFGLVGDIEDVNSEFFKSCIDNRIIPVVCSVTLGESFELLNTNADTMASEIAQAMAVDYDVHLIYCFEKNGVLRDVEDIDSTIERISKKDFNEMKNSGAIASGIIPKLQTALKATNAGVVEARILNSSALNEYFEGQNPGTLIVGNVE